MSRFTYHRPETVEEAVEVLAEHGAEAKVLAGGQSLLPLLALRLAQPAHLVDIGRLAELGNVASADGGLAMGAAVRHARAESSPAVATAVPLVAGAMPHIGHRAIRSRGTVCGSLAHADPAAELPAVALALGARFTVRGAGGERRIDAADFFEGYLQSAVGEGELLTEVWFPVAPPSSGWSLQEVSRRHGDFAMIGVAVHVAVDAEGLVSEAALAYFGAASTPVRLVEVEDLVVGQAPSADLFAAAAATARSVLRPTGDIHASAAYRTHMAGVLTRRGLAEACGRTGLGVAA